jgi:hypothetical protein
MAWVLGSLKHWREYINSISPEKPDTKIATFHARYKFAADFQSIDVKGMASGTVLVYGAITRIGFSYSALEHLEHILGIRGKPPILAPDLVGKVKKCMPSAMARVSDRMPIASNLESRLEKFFESDSSSDVRPVIEQFRHSLFHGKFTPAGWGLKGQKASVGLLEGLAQVTLRKADDTFTEWFLSQAKN